MYLYKLRIYALRVCTVHAVTGIIDGDYTYLAVDSTEGTVFQVATMNTHELHELMNMYNRSCSHIDFDHLPGPMRMIVFCCRYS